ncbi:transglutaminase family protein [Methylomarinum vadi]|uniref:transglutaminase family protein n=1 Tax=Methylomarinum vadi TaxID=438855 RepID=UPI0004DFB01F|nr:transglutaminase family protein [Methylomarinum vadi]
MDRTEFTHIVNRQDDLIRALDVDVWIGMEPTFTRRFAETPEWLSEALGPEKLQYAYALLDEVLKRSPGGVILHTLGRQYAGEDLPRWNIGYYQAKNKQFCWDGPPDPCLVTKSTAAILEKSIDVAAFWQALNHALNQTSWQSTVFVVEEGLKYRILFRCDGGPAIADVVSKPQLTRSSVHKRKISPTGLTDPLSANGDYLICLDRLTADSAHYTGTSVVVELPEVPDVPVFVQLLQCIARAAEQTSVETLVLQGFPPPVDKDIAWTTITPDPAVIEINQAPADNAENFYDYCEVSFSAAQAVGLNPYRLHYNGVVSDSGGGGQFTLGGPQPSSSPFFRYPHLLPRLVRYCNAHPALSYWFAPPSIGSSSQSPRTDEGVGEIFRELAVALEQLELQDEPSPEFIWRSLSPFMVDPSGNPHRSELNIEKLWNPYMPGRGCLGLVEFRAFRMSRSPECATAIAVLLRSIVAMLSLEDKAAQLVDYGVSLHDQYALPFYLQKDLQSIFNDLLEAGLPLHESLKDMLLKEPVRFIGKAAFHSCYIELQQALEFWPLVGDVASQEGGGSRLVDASTTRLQVTLGLETVDASQLGDWELWLNGYRVPLHQEQDRQGPIKLTGLRYRSFQPYIGLHPGIAPRNAITLVLAHLGLDEALEITYSEWHPKGLAYPGLPKDIEEAEQRTGERFSTRTVSIKEFDQPKKPPESAVSDYCLDLRRLPC